MTRCHYCKEQIALLKQFKDGAFCSAEHRQLFKEQQEKLMYDRVRQYGNRIRKLQVGGSAVATLAPARADDGEVPPMGCFMFEDPELPDGGTPLLWTDQADEDPYDFPGLLEVLGLPVSAASLEWESRASDFVKQSEPGEELTAELASPVTASWPELDPACAALPDRQSSGAIISDLLCMGDFVPLEEIETRAGQSHMDGQSLLIPEDFLMGPFPPELVSRFGTNPGNKILPLHMPLPTAPLRRPHTLELVSVKSSPNIPALKFWPRWLDFDGPKPYRRDSKAEAIETGPEAGSINWSAGSLKIAIFLVPSFLMLIFLLPKALSNVRHASTQARTGLASPSSTQPAPHNTPSHGGGAFRRVQEAVLPRAAVDLYDAFTGEMNEWSHPPSAAVAWRPDRSDGLMPKSLILFNPSMSLSDYRFEFSAQVDQKAVGWVLRATDFDNYYVCKLVVGGEGPLREATFVRYPVSGGKAGEKETKAVPLPVSADSTYKIETIALGDSVSVSIQSMMIDSWSDSKFRTGGIGFLGTKGEGARIQYLRITHQQDTIGKFYAHFVIPAAQAFERMSR